MNEQLLSSILWDHNQLVLLDQTRLPNHIEYKICQTLDEVWNAIQDMVVRGAPAIGVAAAYGLYLGACTISVKNHTDFMQALQKMGGYLVGSRPTAVNLFWAIDRMTRIAAQNDMLEADDLKKRLLKEAIAIHEEDTAINRNIGSYGLGLFKEGMGILTHCNAGALATTAYGTATAPIYLAHEQGWNLKVYADETRPRLQGSTLTAFELYQAGIDVTVITDSMAATVMAQGKIDAVIVGTDRVAANGDVANKIGTLGVAILARYYHIPFYVAAPTPTIDMNTACGAHIPIEERNREEVILGFGTYTAPENIAVYNPAFDVTPHELVTAIVTEKGIVRAPYDENLKKLHSDQ